MPSFNIKYVEGNQIFTKSDGEKLRENLKNDIISEIEKIITHLAAQAGNNDWLTSREVAQRYKYASPNSLARHFRKFSKMHGGKRLYDRQAIDRALREGNNGE